MTDYNGNSQTICSPQSTEKLLFEYLRPQLEKHHSPEHQQPSEYDLLLLQQEEIKQQQLFLTACWDDTFLSLEEEDSNIMIELNTFSDLKVALKDIEDLDPLPTSSLRARALQKKSYAQNRWSTTEEDLIDLSSTDFTVPSSVRLTIESSQMLGMLMHQAIQHWCCIGFKVAPISVSLIENWRLAPQAIVYCIASISLVTFMDQENTSSHYSKQVAMVFYEQARHKMDDILFDDMQPLIIQSYFCLSYTSNLLRLYEQQRTWGGLASISLQHLAKNLPNHKEPIDQLTLGCWFRWYYVDAWMCLTLNRDCLLPDNVPWMDMRMIEKFSISSPGGGDHHQLYSFASLTCYMRKYIRALHSGKLFSNDQQKLPSTLYYQITKELIHWYTQLPRYTSIAGLHLHLCYNSMRLVVLYQFLTPQQPPSHDVLIDCLQTNVELLQALQELKDVGCDQSTYHHMFFAIHNTAKRIFQYNQKQFKTYAEEQLKINLMLLKSTQAYAHDVFKMKIYADKIQDQFTRMKIFTRPVGESITFRRNNTIVHSSIQTNVVLKKTVPAVIVFKRENITTIKRRKNK
ncbi:hypothetical protein EDC94DRAFT_618982 [Helicostylum pulchrum]|nr:hypothetical protein EDC94DRAFT_618982 [Helicostylum pulchrum]